MYLSKLTLDPRHPQARRDLSDAYEMHRTLSRVFAPDAHTPPTRFLWRLETSFDGSLSANLLVQSDTLANWSALDSLSGYTVQLHGNKPVDLGQLLQVGRRYRFRLRANPTVTRDHQRHGLRQEDEQLSWLARQVAKHGSVLHGSLRLDSERLQTRRGHNQTAQRITVQTALFEGLLQIRDPQMMQQAIRQGIGHGKALGLGLWSLAPLG